MVNKLISAGIINTGAGELKTALKILGYHSCYDTKSFFTNYNQIKMWEEAAMNNEVNWEKVFKSCNVIIGYPCLLYYKKIYNYYPNSKVILTIKHPQEWYENMLKSLEKFKYSPTKILRLFLALPISFKTKYLFDFFKNNSNSMAINNILSQLKNKDFAFEMYYNHLEEVKNNIPSKDLLIYRTEDGWKPLCDFLNQKAPNIIYPKDHNTEENILTYNISA